MFGTIRFVSLRSFRWCALSCPVLLHSLTIVPRTCDGARVGRPWQSCRGFVLAPFVFHFPVTCLIPFDSSRHACSDDLSRLLYDGVNSFSKVHENGTHLHALPRFHFRKLENILCLQSTEILDTYALKRKNIPSANRANDMIISKVTSDHFTSSLARATVDAM